MNTVLDSWAVLRFLEGRDPAATRVEALVAEGRPTMSWINLGEVYYVLRRSVGTEEAETTIRDLRPRLALELPSQRRVLEAAGIKADYPLAYADAFAAATAIAHGAVLLTGDPELLRDGADWGWEDLR